MILEAVMEREHPMAEEDSVVTLVTRYQHRLYRYLLRLVRDPAAAEDLFQQTWLRVLQALRRYDARRRFEAWRAWTSLRLSRPPLIRTPWSVAWPWNGPASWP
jgi:DNA-directed RNA polymerase specialized sigma24 family protein